VISTVMLVWIAVMFVFPMILFAQDAGSETSSPATTGDPWDRAVEAVQYRRHGEAIPLLRLVAGRPGEHRTEAYRLLAHALEQDGRLDDVEATLRAAIDETDVDEAGRLAFDLAAFFQRHERPAEAEQMYTEALRFDGSLAPAYLNRANVRVEAGTYPEAVEDYELYLALRPRSAQRPQVEQMIALLQQEIEAEEARLAAEERRRAEEEEEQRIAAEERRRREEAEREAAAARREEMLSSVLESLGNAQEGTESFELESEEIQDYEEEIDILD
jgi:tetratricopeptide (TPR) repeat protein